MLDLGGNKISNLEAGIFSKLINLTYLKMNEINKNTLQGLSNLILLDFRKNEIKTIKDGAFEFTPKIEKLTLSGNQIELLIKQTFAGLTNSKTLNLKANPIRKTNMNAFANLSLTDR